MTFGLCARLIFNATQAVWSKTGNDLTLAVIPWWTFGYQEMQRGNFALWNPHNFCGTPFFTNFNPGMLYPLHLLCVLLPLKDALNLILPINVALSGWFTSLWCRNRGVSATGSIVAGVIYMFSGAYFHHSYAGHESPMAAMSLAPLVFLCVDGIFFENARHWILLGVIAVALQCFAGFPQAVYFTALITTLYVALRTAFSENRLRYVRRFCLMYAGGAMIAAVQLLPGLQTASESMRQSGNNFQFATICPLPFVNLVHLLAPAVLGDAEHSPYLGTWYPWEVSIFCGVSTLILATCGALFGDPRKRRFSTTLALVSLVLALGVNVKPLYLVLYHVLPLYRSFRCTTRFNWFMTLHIAMLSGIGFDLLVNMRPWRRWPTAVAFGGALFLSVLSIGCLFSARSGLSGIWGHMAQSLVTSHDHIFGPPVVDDAMAAGTGLFAAGQFFFSAIMLLCLAGGFLSLRWWPAGKFLVAGVTILELVVFADGILVSCPIHPLYPSNWAAARDGESSEFRSLHLGLEFPNTAMVYNFDDVYGYDPVTIKRYSDFIAATQDQDPDQSNFITQIMRMKYPKLLQLLRCSNVFYMRTMPDPNGNAVRVPHVLAVDSPMPHLALIGRYIIAGSRQEVLSGLRKPEFDPRQTVFLESPPDPAPSSALFTVKAAGSAWIDKSSTDWMEIKADLPEPAILLVTDAYSKYWRARSIEPGPQPKYNVMPADYALRAIPLAAGKHHFLLEYAPIGYKIGKWVSILSLLMWIFLLLRHYRKAARNLATSGNEQSTMAMATAQLP